MKVLFHENDGDHVGSRDTGSRSNDSPRHGNGKTAPLVCKLPERRPDRTWGGMGAGASCAICGAPTTSDELEFELEFDRDGGPDFDRYYVHVRCFQAWEGERSGDSGRSATSDA